MDIEPSSGATQENAGMMNVTSSPSSSSPSKAKSKLGKRTHSTGGSGSSEDDMDVETPIDNGDNDDNIGTTQASPKRELTEEEYAARQEQESKDEATMNLSEGGYQSWKRPRVPHIDPVMDSIGAFSLSLSTSLSLPLSLSLSLSLSLPLKFVFSFRAIFLHSLHFLSLTPSLPPSPQHTAFQQMDLDYTVAKPPHYDKTKPRPTTRAPVIRMFGVTEKGNSVMCWVHDFKPYFYVLCPAWFKADSPVHVANAISKALRDDNRFREYSEPVLAIDVVKKQSVWGYQFEKESDFMKITLQIPTMISTSRGIMEKGIVVNGEMCNFQTYESNLVFALRFMIDREIQGASWVELPKGTYHIRSPITKESHCQIEVDISYSDLISHQPEGEWLKQAPIRTLSFDIECAGRKDKFPEAEIDPVIQIANLVSVQGEDEPVAKNVFTLKGCSSIAGTQILSFDDEKDLLSAWKDFLVACDPDVITGYNIINFDTPYLLDRARTLGVEDFPYIGRLKNHASTMKESTFSSKAYGTSTSKDITIFGRIQFDLLTVIRREYKLRSYTLNAVSAHFLGQQKEDVHYSIITDLQNGTDETRRRLAVYCLKDAILPQRLLDKLLLLVNYIEMARVTGVPLSFLLTRGQQIKVVSQLFRKARQYNLVVPVRQRVQNDGEKYEGATVIEPKRGFYSVPIATLDFASLYPSIMMAHNLCYTTLISKAQAMAMDPSQYVKTPTGGRFFVFCCVLSLSLIVRFTSLSFLSNPLFLSLSLSISLPHFLPQTILSSQVSVVDFFLRFWKSC